MMSQSSNDRTVKNARTEANATAYRVIVESGRDAGASIVVDRGSFDRSLVGTSPTCQLRLTDPLVSRRHLVLESTAQGLVVIDVGSTNGTTVQGVRVRDAWIDVGARLAIGETVLRIDPATEAEAAPEASSFGRMIGVSRAARRLFALGHELARSVVPVLIEGEAGTGKTLFAETLHEVGPRAGGPFVVFDAEAAPASRAASLLFGGGPGASSADPTDSGGLWGRARGGSLLIGQPALLPLDVQRRLVRLVGGRDALSTATGGAGDVRLIVASRSDLDAAVEIGQVREDFLLLFVGARVPLSALRTRLEDIAALAGHFWTELGGSGDLPSALLEQLQARSWPGNVRELESVIARRASAGDAVTLPRALTDDADENIIERLLDRELPIAQARELLVERFERRYIERVLRRHEHVGQAAAASGLAPRYFRSLKAKYGYGTK